MSSANVTLVKNRFHEEHMRWTHESYETLFAFLKTRGQTDKAALDILSAAIPPLAGGNESFLRDYYTWHVSKGKALGLLPSTTNNVKAISALLAMKKNYPNNLTSDPGSVGSGSGSGTRARKSRRQRKQRKTRKQRKQ